MIRTGIPSRNALRNNSAYHIDDDVNRKEGAANWESIHKYNSGLFSSRQLITRAEPYRATSRHGEDPFTPINQASNDEEADGKPNEDEGAIVKGTGGFSPMPKTTTAFRSRKLTSTSSGRRSSSMRSVLRPRYVKSTIHRDFSIMPNARAKDAQRNRRERMIGQCDNIYRRTYYH